MRKVNITTRVLVIIGSFVLGALAWSAFEAHSDFLLLGGGFGSQSPDRRFSLRIMGNGGHVRIRGGPLGREELLLRYEHNAPDDLYLRGKGNTVSWAKDSSEAVANYRDVIGGREQQIEFHWHTDGTWELQSLGPTFRPR
jgi:hypothetical protein